MPHILAVFGDGVDAGGALSTGVGATEQIVFPPEHRGLHCPLGGVVRHFEPAIGDVSGQRLPTRQGVTD